MIFERFPRRQTAILLIACIAVLALAGKRIAAQGAARAPALREPGPWSSAPSAAARRVTRSAYRTAARVELVVADR